MRNVLMLTAAVVLGGIGFTSTANAGPLPALGISQAQTGVVETVAQRRWIRRNAVPPAAVVTGSVVTAAPIYRPRSCGEFHYWNGTACVDARFVAPDVGPKG